MRCHMRVVAVLLLVMGTGVAAAWAAPANWAAAARQALGVRKPLTWKRTSGLPGSATYPLLCIAGPTRNPGSVATVVGPGALEELPFYTRRQGSLSRFCFGLDPRTPGLIGVSLFFLDGACRLYKAKLDGGEELLYDAAADPLVVALNGRLGHLAPGPPGQRGRLYVSVVDPGGSGVICYLKYEAGRLSLAPYITFSAAKLGGGGKGVFTFVGDTLYMVGQRALYKVPTASALPTAVYQMDPATPDITGLCFLNLTEFFFVTGEGGNGVIFRATLGQRAWQGVLGIRSQNALDTVALLQ